MYGGHAYAIGLGNLSHALAFNDTGINAKPLRFGQSVQRVPQIAETLHALQQLLRGRLGKAGRVFDPIITVEGILCLIADYPPLVGSLIQLVGPQLGGHFIGNFDINGGWRGSAAGAAPAYLGTTCPKVGIEKRARMA